jgi:iron(III) transport system ATP-binding protein
VLSDVSLTLNQGEIACLLGPSGCGKTTALRAIAGFHPLHSGTIKLIQQEVGRVGYQLAPEHRNIGMVFQDYALFPHLSVADNIGFGLYRRTKREREQRVAQMLELVGLRELAHSAPHRPGARAGAAASAAINGRAFFKSGCHATRALGAGGT